MSVLYLFSSGRALQTFYNKSLGNLLPECLLWGEFSRQYCIFPQKKALPLSLRKILLSHAALSVDVSPLEFEGQFLEFLEQSHFIFPFLDELASANVTLEEIDLKDTYGEYEDHLRVLKELERAYLRLLDEMGFYDPILQKGDFLLAALNPYERIEFFVDGFLSPYEKKLLELITEKVEVWLHFSIDPYNRLHFESLCDHEFELFRKNIFDFKNKCLISSEKECGFKDVCGYEFDHSLSQVALCIHKVQEWIDEGLSPEKIAIVLPNENFKESLKLFDEYRNFNYAMGEEFQTQTLYQQLQGILEDECRIVGVGNQQGMNALRALVKALEGTFCNEENQIFLEVIALFENVEALFAHYSLEEMIRLVLLELQERRIDDVGGGRMRVLGVLETRGIELDGVVIVDMNEGLVPKPNEKDLFLSSVIRRRLHLPTHKDRENLQKHYYLSLLRRCQKAAIGWVSDDQNYVSSLVLESQFIPEVNIIHHQGEQYYRCSLLGEMREHKIQKDSVSAHLPKHFTFSYSKLHAFLQCPIAFYYQYLQDLKEQDEQVSLKGSLIHDLLESSYTQASHPKEREALFYRLLNQSYEGRKESEIFELELIGAYMRNFFAREEEYYRQGERIIYLEKSFECEIEGFMFKGKIDRISECEGEVWLIDYKLSKNISKNYLNSNEALLQFVIYQRALEQMGIKQAKSYLCDLYSGDRLICGDLTQSYTLLQETMQCFKQEVIEFNTRKSAACLYCAYCDICGVFYV